MVNKRGIEAPVAAFGEFQKGSFSLVKVGIDITDCCHHQHVERHRQDWAADISQLDPECGSNPINDRLKLLRDFLVYFGEGHSKQQRCDPGHARDQHRVFALDLPSASCALSAGKATVAKGSTKIRPLLNVDGKPGKSWKFRPTAGTDPYSRLGK